MTFYPRLMTRAELIIEQDKARFNQQVANGIVMDPTLEDHSDVCECEECCEHDFDPDEGFMCLNCGLQGEPSDVYDEDYGQDR